MFERRPLLGLLGCLTLVLTIWQISPRDVAVYREPPIPYAPSAAPSPSASSFPSGQTELQRHRAYPGGDDNTLVGTREEEQEEEEEEYGARIAERPPAAAPYEYRVGEESSYTGTAGTYLNLTAPEWLVAAAAAATAGATGGTAKGTSGLSRRGREGAAAGPGGSSPHQGATGSSSSTQSIASLTVANTWGEPLPNDDYTSLIDLKDFRFIINYDYCGVGGAEGIASSSSSGQRGGTGSRANSDYTNRRRRRSRSSQSSLKRGDALRGTWTPAAAAAAAPPPPPSPPSSPPLVLVLIHSAPANLVKRHTIRSTWGQPDRRARLIFLMGAVNSSTVQREIEEESRAYDDIVQGSFVDAYRNMTYKHVMALKWFTYHCPGARYVLKTDDDVFINTPVLYDVLERVAPQQSLLLCQLVTKLAVKRTHRSKWFVSWREYPAPYYPPHCPGYSILYSPDVARQLYREAQRQPFFWIDDVHITGTVAQNVNVTITPMDGLYLDSDEKRDLLDEDTEPAGRIGGGGGGGVGGGGVGGSSGSGGRTVFFFTNPNLSMDEIRRLWVAVVEERNRVRR